MIPGPLIPATDRELPRKLGWWDAAAIIIGIVIGSGIFLLPNIIADEVPSSVAILSVWIVSGVLSYFGALAYAELGAMMPATGGQYVYLREAYGRLCAFASGWTFILVVLAGGTAWLAVTFSIYLGQFMNLTPVMSKATSLALIAVIATVNFVGVKAGAIVQNVFTILKVMSLLLLIASAFLVPRHSLPAIISTRPTLTAAHFGGAMIACLMAYDGWTFISFVAGEIKEPQRNLPRALGVGIAIVILLYLSANIAYLRIFSISQIAKTERIGSALAEYTLGPLGATVVSITILISIVAAVNGCILTASRIPFALARDGLFFRPFGRVHPRFHTPSFAIVVQAMWTGVLVLSGSYRTLFSYSMVAAWIFYALTGAAVFVLRRKSPNLCRPYKMWGYPVTLVLFLLIAGWFVINAFVVQPWPSIMALLVIVSGVLVYGIWSRFAPEDMIRPVCRLENSLED